VLATGALPDGGAGLVAAVIACLPIPSPPPPASSLEVGSRGDGGSGGAGVGLQSGAKGVWVEPPPLSLLAHVTESAALSADVLRSAEAGPAETLTASHSLRSGAYRVFTRKRAFLVKSSVTILRTGLHVAVNGDFAHNNLRSGTAFRPDCYLYTIRSASPR